MVHGFHPLWLGFLGRIVLTGMDYIYFFTDTMNHSMYYKYIGIMRQRQKNYYYIHETNIEKNIRQIYGDIVKVG